MEYTLFGIPHGICIQSLCAHTLRHRKAKMDPCAESVASQTPAAQGGPHCSRLRPLGAAGFRYATDPKCQSIPKQNRKTKTLDGRVDVP